MRVLILFAFVAFAAAAPSGNFAPLFYQSVAIPASLPTISPGDIQAAAIDAQVQVNDLTRAAADKAQDLADQAVSNANEKVVTDVDQIKERSLEAFWSAEDKKWQALDAIKTAEAQIDGAAASNADAYAKSAITGAYPYVAVAVVAPVVAAPVPPIVYNPNVAAVKSVSTQTVEVKAEENKERMTEAAVKTAESEKPAEMTAEKSEKMEAAGAKTPEVGKSVVLPGPAVWTSGPIVAPFAGVYRYDVALPGISHYLAQPIVNYATSYQQLNGVVAPTLIKHAW